VSALASSIKKCTVLTSVSERYACYEALREVFSRPRGDVRSKGVFKQCSGSMRRRDIVALTADPMSKKLIERDVEKAEALDRLPAKRARMLVLPSLSASRAQLWAY
jgi:hypothetical protein